MPVSKDDEIEREIQGLLIEFDVPPSSRDMIAMMLRSYVQQLIHTREEQSINKFCVDLAHKVEMSFKIHPPGHIVMPWEDVVRNIVHKRASQLKENKEAE